MVACLPLSLRFLQGKVIGQNGQVGGALLEQTQGTGSSATLPATTVDLVRGLDFSRMSGPGCIWADRELVL